MKPFAITILTLLPLPAVAAAEPCDETISLKHDAEDGESEGDTTLLWISENLLASGVACEGVASKVIRQALSAPGWNGPCSRLPEITSFADGTPETFHLKPGLLQTVLRRQVVVVGTVESLTPGFGESMAAGHVVTRIQMTVAESLRRSRGLGDVGTQLVLLQVGGTLRAGSATRCSDRPPYVHAWKSGDRLLLAADPAASTEPNYVHGWLTAYRVDEDGQVTAPPNSPLVAGAATLDEIRESLRRTTDAP